MGIISNKKLTKFSLLSDIRSWTRSLIGQPPSICWLERSKTSKSASEFFPSIDTCSGQTGCTAETLSLTSKKRWSTSTITWVVRRMRRPWESTWTMRLLNPLPVLFSATPPNYFLEWESIPAVPCSSSESCSSAWGASGSSSWYSGCVTRIIHKGQRQWSWVRKNKTILSLQRGQNLFLRRLRYPTILRISDTYFNTVLFIIYFIFMCFPSIFMNVSILEILPLLLEIEFQWPRQGFSATTLPSNT